MLLQLQRKIDKITTIISSVLLGIMMIILVYNVAARFIGGGITWYMEGSQYLNVWAMFIAGISLCVTSDQLRITMIEDLLGEKTKKIAKVIVAILTFFFYLFLAYGSYLLATKSMQQISTMPGLKMSYVYWMLPVTSVLSAISVLIGVAVELQNPVMKGDSSI